METYRDRLRHHIRNKDLLDLIESYHNKFPQPNFRYLLNKEMHPTDSHILPQTLLTTLFDSKKTKEKENYWSSIYWTIFLPNEIIYNWKHIDEWFQDKNTPQALKNNKDIYINTLRNHLAPRKLLYFSDPIQPLRIIRFCINSPQISEKEKLIIHFAHKHNRFPNDFEM